MCVVADSGVAVKPAASGVRSWLVPRPGLFELLNTGERVVLVSAPAGSGKTFLLRSWIAAEALGERAAWVSVGRGEHDPQGFWLSVLDSLRGTRVGAERVRELTAAPDLDGATVVGRLLEDLGSLDERLWLVIDDLHELRADEAIRQVEVLMGSAPPQLRLALLTRRDLRLGLHRLRAEGELTEIRAEDLQFTMGESRALLEAAGVRLSDGAVGSLVARTEGWAAGLRLAAISLARDPDPERLAASFSGRERAVAEYLLAEVLDRQPEEVTRLLLRTSILERVSGALAVNCPVIRTRETAKRGRLVVLVSGPADALDRAQPIFDAIAAKTVRLEPETGRVSRLKLMATAWTVGLVESLRAQLSRAARGARSRGSRWR